MSEFNINNYFKNGKIFLMTFIPMFLIVTFQLTGLQPPRLISPFAQTPNQIDMEEVIYKKLSEKENSYTIQNPLQLSLVSTSYASDTQAENAAAYGVIDYDSGEIIAQKALSERLPVASLTKIMTAVVALDLVSPTEVFTITPTASAAIPTKIGVVPGQKMTLNELLHATLLTSANDAAQAIKEGIDTQYGKGTFIKSMNAKAKFIGLKNSHFSNPQGFDNPKNYSTVEDLAILSHYALSNYPLIADISTKDYQYLEEDTNHKDFDLVNWNGLLGVYPNILGFKIGNTGKAGKTTVVISERGNKKILAILLGAPGVLERDLWAAELLDLGFNKTMRLEPIGITEEQLLAKYKTWQNWSK